MANKFLFQFITFLCLFFGAWYFLSKVDFTGKINVKKISKYNEQKLGKIVIDFLKNNNRSVDSDSANKIVNSIKERICKSNKLDTSDVRIYIFYGTDINAFALPGNNMVIYTGLINFCKNPEELSSVMAHEIAHIEHRHIVKKLSKEIGISMLATLAGGNSSNEILREVVQTISSTAFDRDMEREADTTAVRYMANTGIDPVHFADLLFRLSKKSDVPKNFEWISTHPNTKERTAEILDLRKKSKFKIVPLMPDAQWKYLKEEIKEEDYKTEREAAQREDHHH
jgi:beta-barrel assembly-enhancing protease